MNPDQDVHRFLEESGTYMDINALRPDWEQYFVHAIRKIKNEELKESFRKGFAKAVLGGLRPREYEKATGWDFDTEQEFVEHLKHYWAIFYPDSKPEDFAAPSSGLTDPNAYRGYKNQEGDQVWYSVERLDGVEVVRVHSLVVVERTLNVSYDLTSPSMYDGFARSLIKAKILRDVCLDAYRSIADAITFKSLSTGLVATLPYD
jgi:hypothetical protein